MNTPEPKQRSAFDSWLRNRKLNYSTAAARIGCSRETLRRYCLPFEDQEHRFPTKALLVKIADLTDGEITGHDFLPPARDNANVTVEALPLVTAAA